MRRTALAAAALCAVLAAVTIAVPAMGGPNVLKIAKKARKSAKKANKTAKAARVTAAAALAKGGPTGPAGAPGKDGADGTGTLNDVLQSGGTIRQGWGFGGVATDDVPRVLGQLPFPVPLGFQPEVAIVEENGAPNANCTGSAADPTAAPGYLCVYVGYKQTSATLHQFIGLEDGGASRRYGVQLYVDSDPGKWESSGTYAVTAP